MQILFREGRKEDCNRIAELDNIASGGAISFLFHDLIPGMTPVQVVAQSLSSEGQAHSFRNTIAAEYNEQIIGMALSFPSRCHGITEELRNFLPPDRLEHFKDFFSSRVEDSYFLDALAVDEKYRNKGIGRGLIARTMEKARKEGFRTLSLITYADNRTALQLYQKIGFVIVKHIDLKRHPLLPHEGGCPLLKCDFDTVR
jgi:GNAT superfamily N-acetyltransferase